ncbi:MAG: penicillin acylase family protein [Fimbriimonadaceae bacterium]|jgi:penicillin amidase|nr:penicillin acylase family protein [Fimbriimonadaceae bacterium]
MSGILSILFLSILQEKSPAGEGIIRRGEFGVPILSASSQPKAFFLLGRALAEDRLWQMELSRRSARGKLSEILGPTAFASDRDILRRSYTDAELEAMVNAMPTPVRRAWEEYANGINATIRIRTAARTLPPNYKDLGFLPKPWSTVDSAAIAVTLARRFGGGGAGELRNYALYQYLQSQPKAKDKRIEVLNDLAWFNDPRAVTTVLPEDDRINPRPVFPLPTRAQTEAHLASLPPTSLLELAGAAMAATLEDSQVLAEQLSIATQLGSYAVAINGNKSKDGRARLLHAPQMGFTTPSVVHESTMEAPGMRVKGMTVPGVPTYLIGRTPNFAWTLTTGVADIEDIFVSKLEGENEYLSGTTKRPLQTVRFRVKVKGEADREVVQWRTHRGPVLLLSRSSKAVYSLQSSFAGKELKGYSDVYSFYGRALDRASFDRVVAGIPVNFNVFFADRRGNIGYRYSGLVPLRAPGVDPRFPVPDEPQNEWRGFLPPSQMPHVHNPRGGMIANWNNKPVSWWPNGDTPAWGRLFRNTVLLRALRQPKVGYEDLLGVTKAISNGDQASDLAFLPVLRLALASVQTPGAKAIRDWDGRFVTGSVGANLYQRFIAELRVRLFRPMIGNLTNDGLFRQAIQPSLILNALESQTEIDWLDGQNRLVVVREAFAEVERGFASTPMDRWGLPARTITFGTLTIPFSDRGTYLQVTDWGRVPHSVNVVIPGNAESGPHAFDQVGLGAEFRLKPMAPWPGGG